VIRLAVIIIRATAFPNQLLREISQEASSGVTGSGFRQFAFQFESAPHMAGTPG
jgi:hypothetical protein